MPRSAILCTLMVRIFTFITCMLVAVVASPADAQLQTERTYYQVNRPVPMRVVVPENVEGVPQIRLYARAGADAEQPDGLAHELVASAAASEGRVELASLFPILWTAPEPRVLFAQLVVDEIPVGPPVVLEPLVSVSRASSTLEHRVGEALEAGDRAALLQLLGLPDFRKNRLRQEVHLEPPARRTYSGLRTYTLKHILFETTFGDLEARLRPDIAPRTAWHILQLAERGFYTDIDIHRVLNDDGRGRPFIIQAGDPTGTGFGGPGFQIDFEPSDLPHDFGVLSLARRPTEPNSGGSQFFICLSREACAGLDGHYTAYGEIVNGATVIDAMRAVAVDLADPNDPNSSFDRPIEPPVITKATLIDAPACGQGLPAVTPPEDAPVER